MPWGSNHLPEGAWGSNYRGCGPGTQTGLIRCPNRLGRGGSRAEPTSALVRCSELQTRAPSAAEGGVVQGAVLPGTHMVKWRMGPSSEDHEIHYKQVVFHFHVSSRERERVTKETVREQICIAFTGWAAHGFSVQGRSWKILLCNEYLRWLSSGKYQSCWENLVEGKPLQNPSSSLEGN